jgi:hypothetical protein
MNRNIGCRGGLNAATGDQQHLGAHQSYTIRSIQDVAVNLNEAAIIAAIISMEKSKSEGGCRRPEKNRRTNPDNSYI